MTSTTEKADREIEVHLVGIEKRNSYLVGLEIITPFNDGVTW